MYKQVIISHMTKNALGTAPVILAFVLLAGVIGFFSFSEKSPFNQSDNDVASIFLTDSPSVKTIARNDSMHFVWESANAPAGSVVYLQLTPIKSAGESQGIIVSGLPVDGQYDWVIPPASDTMQIAGDYSLHGEDIQSGKTYQVRIGLYIPTTKQCFEGCPPSTGTPLAETLSAPFTIQ